MFTGLSFFVHVSAMTSIKFLVHVPVASPRHCNRLMIQALQGGPSVTSVRVWGSFPDLMCSKPLKSTRSVQRGEQTRTRLPTLRPLSRHGGCWVTWRGNEEVLGILAFALWHQRVPFAAQKSKKPARSRQHIDIVPHCRLADCVPTCELPLYSTYVEYVRRGHHGSIITTRFHRFPSLDPARCNRRTTATTSCPSGQHLGSSSDHGLSWPSAFAELILHRRSRAVSGVDPRCAFQQQQDCGARRRCWHGFHSSWCKVSLPALPRLRGQASGTSRMTFASLPVLLHLPGHTTRQQPST